MYLVLIKLAYGIPVVSILHIGKPMASNTIQQRTIYSQHEWSGGTISSMTVHSTVTPPPCLVSKNGMQNLMLKTAFCENCDQSPLTYYYSTPKRKLSRNIFPIA